jgi:peroxiredoxin/tetratricopeptide (TPR) repeat protein
MNRRLIVSPLALGVLFCAGPLAAGADDPVAAAPAVTGPVVGAPAPDFSMQTLAGKTVTLASFRGKTLVINTWATWCPPCRAEMPELIATARTLQKSGVAVLGVDSTEEAPIVRGYVAAHNVSYPQAIDTTKSFSTAYDIEYFPTTFVIDPSGIVRARIVDGVTPKELNAVVADASAGRSAVITSPLQTKIDTTLADSNFTFSGDADAVTKNAEAVAKAIDSAQDLLDQSDAASGNATDFVRTQAEEMTIRDRAIASLKARSSSVTVSDKSLLPILEGDAARDREQWQAAIDAYATVLALDPKNDDALEGTAYAAGRLKQYDLVVATDTKIAALAPTSTGDLIDLARAQAADGKQSDADATFEKALALAQPAYDAHPSDPKAIKPLASVHLYYGRTLAKAGDAAHARTQFEALSLLATKLPTTDSRHDMYLEEAQEAIVALDLGGTQTGAKLSVVPWTGAVLPGSIPDTIKYRVVVAGTAGKTIALAASDVPKGWVASFCSDKICAPFHVSVEIPDGGVKIVEFQLVPPAGKAPAPKVRITSTGDGPQASVTT